MTSTSGYAAKIDYSGKGWLSGKKNSFSATLYPAGKEKEVLYTIDGQWNETFTIHRGHKKEGTVIEVFSHSSCPTSKLIVAPLEEQDLLESKRAWNKVAAAILKGDMNTTSNEKTKIEVSQRDLRKREVAEGKVYQRTFFSKVANDPLFDKLAKGIGESIEAEKTGGIWRFDVEKAKHAKPPYGVVHGNLVAQI